MMITRQGTIISATGQQITVKVAIPPGCSGCGKRDACTQGNERVMTMTCDEPLQQGQAVELSIPEADLLGIAALVHLMPAVALLVGAALGEAIGKSSAYALLGAALGLACALIGLKHLASRLPATQLAAVRPHAASSTLSCLSGPQNERS